MSIRKWFGRVFVGGSEAQKREEESRLSDWLRDSGAMMAVFRINNGYIVRFVAAHAPIESGFQFCSNHEELTDYLAKSLVMNRLNIQPQQLDLFSGKTYQSAPLTTKSLTTKSP